MTFGLFLATMAGGRREVLQFARGDIPRQAAMGGVLVMTSLLAAVSSAFAVTLALHPPVVVTVTVGLAWGLFVFTVDRLIISQIVRRTSIRQSLLQILPRLVVALLVGIVTATPLVLQVFRSEIDAELAVMRIEQISAYNRQLVTTSLYSEISTLQRRITQNQQIIAAGGNADVSSDPAVVAAQKQYDAAEARYRSAENTVICEIDGTCGSGKAGQGPAYREKLAVRDEARAARDRALANLQTARAKAGSALAERNAAAVETARAQLAQDRSSLSQLQTLQARNQSDFSAAVRANQGILIRLEALDRLSSGHAPVRSALLTIFGLLLMIQLLPVTLKALQTIGEATAYEKIAVDLEARDVALARVRHLQSIDQAVIEAIVTDRQRLALETRSALTDAYRQMLDVLSPPDGIAARPLEHLALERSDAVIDLTTSGSDTRADPHPVSSPPDERHPAQAAPPPRAGIPVVRELRGAPRPLPADPPDRFLTAHLPTHVGLGKKIPLLVSIGTRYDTVSARLKPFTVPPEGRTVVITVSAPGLKPVGDLEQELTVRASGESEPVRFGFVTVAPGLHRVEISAFLGGTFLGQLVLEVSVEQGAALREGEPRHADLAPLRANSGEITLQVNREEGGISFQLIGEAWHRRVVVQTLGSDPTVVVERTLTELQAMARGRSGYDSAVSVRNRLQSLGANLWADLVPKTIKDQFWEQIDDVLSFTVMSDLDTIPWELVYAVDRHHEYGFLSERLPLVRQVYGRKPVSELHVDSAAFVIPPRSPLDAHTEITSLRTLLGGMTTSDAPVDRLEDLMWLFDHPPGLLHFACHNSFSLGSGSVVTMDGGPVSPMDLALRVQRQTLMDRSPLVFINACRTAGEIFGFTELSGWASQFMAAGAGGFVGTLWPVRSAAAREFAQSFYRSFLREGRPLGTSSLAARQSIAEDLGDPTWLAYSVYGNPAATALAPAGLPPGRHPEVPVPPAASGGPDER